MSRQNWHHIDEKATTMALFRTPSQARAADLDRRDTNVAEAVSSSRGGISTAGAATSSRGGATTAGTVAQSQRSAGTAATVTLSQRQPNHPARSHPGQRYRKPMLVLIGSRAGLLEALGPAQANYGGMGLP